MSFHCNDMSNIIRFILPIAMQNMHLSVLQCFNINCLQITLDLSWWVITYLNKKNEFTRTNQRQPCPTFFFKLKPPNTLLLIWSDIKLHYFKIQQYASAVLTEGTG